MTSNLEKSTVAGGAHMAPLPEERNPEAASAALADEIARDQQLSQRLNTELAAETSDADNAAADLVTGMGGGDDPIGDGDGVQVESDLEEEEEFDNA